VLLFGVLVAAVSLGGGAYLGWENRHAQVHLEVAGHVWTGQLYGVLLAGALLAGWTMFGLSCIGLWRRERRERRAAAEAAFEAAVDSAAAEPAVRPVAAPVAAPAADEPRRGGPARRSRPVLTPAARR